MKKIYLYIISLIFAGGIFSACEKIEPPFFDKDANGIYFDYGTKEELTDTINFANYALQNPTELPVDLRLKLLGYISDQNRKVVLKSKAVEGFPLAHVSIPDIVFKADSFKQKIKVNVQRPADRNQVYAVCIYIDVEDPMAQIGKGIEGFGEFNLYVKESYTKPQSWDWGVGIYLGTWTAEKHVFMIHVTRDNGYAESNDWDKFAKYNVKAVDSLRVYQQQNPDKAVPVDIPFTTQAKYDKPFYWTSLHDKYLGDYSSKTFADFAVSQKISTLNEKSFFSGDENHIKALNKKAVMRMMEIYNTFFQWGYSGNIYRTSFWVPVLTDMDYPVSKPACWENKGCAALLERYYGEYSDEKYKFMIRSWLKKKGESDFVIVQMFPVISGWGDDGRPLAMWDETLNGEKAIKECYKVFKQAYNQNPGAYTFTFPDININE